jgi:CubicO group peptidase (beta-lactamase class C family)
MHALRHRALSFFTVVAMLMAASCGSHNLRLSGSKLPYGSWIGHGFSDVQREQLREVMREGISNKIVPGGSLMLVHKGDVIFREAFGVADIETQRPFSTDDYCWIASITKPHTAVVLAILSDRGLLSLDDHVDKYLPEFGNLRLRNGDRIDKAPTIKQCLSHTTGFAGNRAIKSGAFVFNVSGTLAQAVSDLATKPLYAKPGKRFAYTRIGYMIAARVAEVVVGKPFEEIMSEELLRPLGLTKATFHPSEELRKGMPVFHIRKGGGFEPRIRPMRKGCINPGGGLVSSLDGVGKLMLLHRNKGMLNTRQVVRAETLEQMYMPQPGTKRPKYGLGFNIQRQATPNRLPRVQHTGASGTLALIDFDADLIIVMMTQVPSPQMQRLRRQVVMKVNEIFTP